MGAARLHIHCFCTWYTPPPQYQGQELAYVYTPLLYTKNVLLNILNISLGINEKVQAGIFCTQRFSQGSHGNSIIILLILPHVLQKEYIYKIIKIFNSKHSKKQKNILQHTFCFCYDHRVGKKYNNLQKKSSILPGIVGIASASPVYKGILNSRNNSRQR